MSFAFQGAKAFSADLSKWDTSKVTRMYYMFYNAKSFNGDISSWNTGKVTYMRDMFHDAMSFNQDLSGWSIQSMLPPVPNWAQSTYVKKQKLKNKTP
jgi:surface protein